MRGVYNINVAWIISRAKSSLVDQTEHQRRNTRDDFELLNESYITGDLRCGAPCRISQFMLFYGLKIAHYTLRLWENCFPNNRFTKQQTCRPNNSNSDVYRVQFCQIMYNSLAILGRDCGNTMMICGDIVRFTPSGKFCR